MTKPWFLYLLECKSGAIYTGITTDVEARFKAHMTGRGAKYTRANPPVRIIGQVQCKDRSEASKLEIKIKELTPKKKIWLVNYMADHNHTRIGACQTKERLVENQEVGRISI